MTTGEHLVDISTLSTGTALNHFLNISVGGGTTIIRNVMPFYKVKYILTETGIIKYIKPPKQLVKYINSDTFKVKYIHLPNSKIKYVKNKTIKITYKCN